MEKARRKTGWKVSHYLLEGLFSSVGSDVVVESGGPSKGTATVAALERPVTGVSDHVVPQFWRLGKGLGAVTALVGSETNKETAWLVSGSQHCEAKVTTFCWHFLCCIVFWPLGSHYLTSCHRNKIHITAETLIPKQLFFPGINFTILRAPAFLFLLPPPGKYLCIWGNVESTDLTT